MNSVMFKGVLLAGCGALVIAFGDALGLDLDQVALLGTALGAVIGLVPDHTLTRRIAAFALGFALTWAGYGFRAAVLPDVAAGRAVVAFAVILLAVTIAAAATLPLWSVLIGSAAMVGAYEQTYAAAPSLFATDSPEAATTVLLACAAGVLGTTLVGSLSPARNDVSTQEPTREQVSA